MSDLKEKEIATSGLADVEVEAGETHRRGKFAQMLKGRTNDLNELGKDMLQKSLEYDEAQLEQDAVKVRRKLDFMVLPMVSAAMC